MQACAHIGKHCIINAWGLRLIMNVSLKTLFIFRLILRCAVMCMYRRCLVGAGTTIIPGVKIEEMEC